MKILIICLFLVLPAHAQFSNESEVSLLQTGGNAEVQTNNLKTLNIYNWDKNRARLGGHYTYGESSEGVTVRNWDVNSKYERDITDRLSWILGEVVEGNRFIGYNARYNTDLGLKYYYIKSDPKTFFTEVGLRYSIEDRVKPAENAYDNKGRIYNEFAHKYSEAVQYKLWLEYVPNFTDTDDYLVNGEASVMAIMNSTFSLKFAYLGMYDDKPAQPGLKNYDFATTTSLVAKF